MFPWQNDTLKYLLKSKGVSGIEMGLSKILYNVFRKQTWIFAKYYVVKSKILIKHEK